MDTKPLGGLDAIPAPVGLRAGRQLGEIAWAGNADYRLAERRAERRESVRQSLTRGGASSADRKTAAALPPLRRRATQPMRYAKRPPLVFG